MKLYFLELIIKITEFSYMAISFPEVAFKVNNRVYKWLSIVMGHWKTQHCLQNIENIPIHYLFLLLNNIILRQSNYKTQKHILKRN